MKSFFALTITVLFFISSVVFAADDNSKDSLSELAKQTQNPVAPMISVPFQGNINLNSGPEKNTQVIVNFQPVIPVPLSKKWNLINRIVLPIISNPQPVKEFGLGDTNISFFFSPARPSKFIWGLGPVVQIPTATSSTLGSGIWAAGPTGVGVYMDGPWVIGVLANNRWTFAGPGNRPYYNQMLLQPFINYNLPKGWSLGTSPEMNVDWTASPGQQWTIPVGGTVSKVFKAGPQMMSAAAGGYYNVTSPTETSDWTIRLVLSLLFPEKVN
jgi:hypothetical protein